MNAVGIDISKGKSMIAVMRPFGEVVASQYEITHTDRELKELTKFLKGLSGETKVIMEYTGRYYQLIARHLREAGIFVSVVNAILVHDYGGNSLRRVKTDKKDAIKIANYGLDRWVDLMEYTPEEDVRRFYAKKALITFAGLDAPPYQSGAFESKKRNMSKRGSASLRKTLFQVISVILQNASADELVYQFLDKKRTEGKHYGVYMMAAVNKFLRIYYARTKEHLLSLDQADHSVPPGSVP